MLPEFRLTDRMAVFLDFDGTLVDIVQRPDLVLIPAGLGETLMAVHDRLGGALAVITGRAIADLDQLLTPVRLPAAGVHGLEYRDNSGIMYADSPTTIPEHVRNRLLALAASAPGLILEDKGVSLAMHYRQAPDKEAIIRDELAAIGAELGTDFVLQDGKMVIELRPGNATKGTAVRKFMSEPPFAGRRPIFIGDDITDEDAFRVVNEMHGHSIIVGAVDDFSAARFALPDVSAVQSWIDPVRIRPDNESIKPE